MTYNHDSMNPVNWKFFIASLLNSSKAKVACRLTTVEIKSSWQQLLGSWNYYSVGSK